MATAQKRKRKRKSAAPLPPDVVLHSKIQKIFVRAGFTEFKTDGQKVFLGGWGGDIDCTFLCENIVVLCERTTTADPWKHLKPKGSFFTSALQSPIETLSELSRISPALSLALDNSLYDRTQYRIRVVYVSEEEISKSHQRLLPDIRFMHQTELRFFLHLTDCIHRSGKHELLRYLSVNANEFGSHVVSGQSLPSKEYSSFLLPTTHSSLPAQHEVISFYADPGFLLETCFVLRRDGWQEDGALYQRLLAPKKLRAMRKHLVANKRVFVNNIIVALPEDSTVSPAKGVGGASQITLKIPHAFNSIAIIDGQHRVFCYYEGQDADEEHIKKMRVKQNLLVTAIRFPTGTSHWVRERFEAALFLEINSNQTGAKTALKQDIAVLLTPSSNAAIAKRVMARLNSEGPLERMMRLSELDPKDLIASSSMVTYGLIPLVKLEGNDSLYSAWNNPSKSKIKEDDAVREEYIDFCVDTINDFLSAARLNFPSNAWVKKQNQPGSKGILTQTLLTACLVCLRRVIEAGKSLSLQDNSKALSSLPKVDFDEFKRSSLWKKLGDRIFQVCFP
jgi:DGQHR domain-containing protein